MTIKTSIRIKVTEETEETAMTLTRRLSQGIPLAYQNVRSFSYEREGLDIVLLFTISGDKFAPLGPIHDYIVYVFDNHVQYPTEKATCPEDTSAVAEINAYPC